MTLGTHALVGAAAASFFPGRPILAFTLGFASHFLVDAIPHRDYPIRSDFVNPTLAGKAFLNKELLRDIFVIGGDAVLGVSLALLLFGRPELYFVIFLGACGAIFPDPLQFVQAHLPFEPLNSLQKFHQWIHTTKRFEESLFWGITTQIIFVFCVVFVTEFLLL